MIDNPVNLSGKLGLLAYAHLGRQFARDRLAQFGASIEWPFLAIQRPAYGQARATIEQRKTDLLATLGRVIVLRLRLHRTEIEVIYREPLCIGAKVDIHSFESDAGLKLPATALFGLRQRDPVAGAFAEDLAIHVAFLGR